MKYAVECDDLVLVGVGGIDCPPDILGGVVELLVLRIPLFLPPLRITISCSSQDRVSLLAISRTRIAVSLSARR